MAEELVSKAEMGRVLGVSGMMVTFYTRKGMPMEGKKVRKQAAIEWHKEHVQSTKEHRRKKRLAAEKKQVSSESTAVQPVLDPAPSRVEMTHSEASKQKEIELYRKNKLANDATEGLLIPAAPTNRAVSTLVMRTTEAMLLIPEEMGDDLAKITDPPAVREMLRKAIEEGLEGLVKYADAA